MGMNYRKRKPQLPYIARPYQTIRHDGVIGTVTVHVLETCLTDYPAPQKLEHRIVIDTFPVLSGKRDQKLLAAYQACERMEIPTAAIFSFTEWETDEAGMEGSVEWCWELVFLNEYDRTTAMFVI